MYVRLSVCVLLSFCVSVCSYLYVWFCGLVCGGSCAAGKADLLILRLVTTIKTIKGDRSIKWFWLKFDFGFFSKEMKVRVCQLFNIGLCHRRM